jgi:hypothetical protein
VRTYEEISADAADERPFSNSTEYEIWADSGKGCYDCIHDDAETEKYCPILSAALLGPSWPKEWTRATHRWQIGDKSGSYEVVDECTEFERRRDDGGPEPTPPPPPPVMEGQTDIFEVFAEQAVEELTRPVAVAS